MVTGPGRARAGLQGWVEGECAGCYRRRPVRRSGAGDANRIGGPGRHSRRALPCTRFVALGFPRLIRVVGPAELGHPTTLALSDVISRSLLGVTGAAACNLVPVAIGPVLAGHADQIRL